MTDPSTKSGESQRKGDSCLIESCKNATSGNLIHESTGNATSNENGYAMQEATKATVDAVMDLSVEGVSPDAINFTSNVDVGQSTHLPHEQAVSIQQGPVKKKRKVATNKLPWPADHLARSSAPGTVFRNSRPPATQASYSIEIQLVRTRDHSEPEISQA